MRMPAALAYISQEAGSSSFQSHHFQSPKFLQILAPKNLPELVLQLLAPVAITLSLVVRWRSFRVNWRTCLSEGQTVMWNNAGKVGAQWKRVWPWSLDFPYRKISISRISSSWSLSVLLDLGLYTSQGMSALDRGSAVKHGKIRGRKTTTCLLFLGNLIIDPSFKTPLWSSAVYGKWASRWWLKFLSSHNNATHSPILKPKWWASPMSLGA